MNLGYWQHKTNTWDDDGAQVTMHDRGITIAVTEEQAVDSYNSTFTCQAEIPMEQAVALARALMSHPPIAAALKAAEETVTYRLVRRAVLMEDEGREHVLGSYPTLEEAQAAIESESGGGYFKPGDFYIKSTKVTGGPEAMTTSTPFGIAAFDTVLVTQEGNGFRFNWPAIEEVAAMPVEGKGSKTIAVYHARVLLAAREEGAKR